MEKDQIELLKNFLNDMLDVYSMNFTFKGRNIIRKLASEEFEINYSNFF